MNWLFCFHKWWPSVWLSFQQRPCLWKSHHFCRILGAWAPQEAASVELDQDRFTPPNSMRNDRKMWWYQSGLDQHRMSTARQRIKLTFTCCYYVQTSWVVMITTGYICFSRRLVLMNIMKVRRCKPLKISICQYTTYYHISFRSGCNLKHWITVREISSWSPSSLILIHLNLSARKERSMNSKYSSQPHLLPLPALRGRRQVPLMEKEYGDHSPVHHFGSLGDNLSWSSQDTEWGGLVVDEKEVF